MTLGVSILLLSKETLRVHFLKENSKEICSVNTLRHQSNELLKCFRRYNVHKHCWSKLSYAYVNTLIIFEHFSSKMENLKTLFLFGFCSFEIPQQQAAFWVNMHIWVFGVLVTLQFWSNYKFIDSISQWRNDNPNSPKHIIFNN